MFVVSKGTHMNWKLYLDTIRAYRSGASLGDVALMKIAAFQTPNPEVRDQLKGLRGYYPELDLAAMRELPNGTLGREYVRFLDAQGIEPFVFSDQVKARFANRPFAVRYTVTHDFHHVLAGFDAGLAGEAGVVAFTVGQGSFSGKWLLTLQRCIYAVFSPSQIREVSNNMKVGYRMGRQAKLLLGERLEEQLHRPLADVRKDLGIPNPKVAGVRASKESWMMRLFYPSVKPAAIA